MSSSIADIIGSLASLAWPVTILSGGYYFRHQIGALLDRLQSIGWPGGPQLSTSQAERAKEAQKSAKDIKEIIASIDPEGKAKHLYPIIEKRAELIRGQIANRRSAEPNFDAEGFLVVHLADTYFSVACLRIYMTIFRSQLEALRRMHETGAEVDLVPYHGLHCERVAASARRDGREPDPFEFDQWARFFTNNNLAVIDDFRGRITPEGRAFVHIVNNSDLPDLTVL